MRIEVAIERGETCLPPIKKQTKCAKMTDESDATIIKNGINGAVAVAGRGGSSSGSGSVVEATTSNVIHVSRGNAINLSSGGSGGSSGNQRMQYSGCPSGGNELSSNQDTSAGVAGHVNNSSNSNSVDNIRSPNTGYGGRLQFFKDGKFILELARAREGERSGWVSVPRKTFWPPSASTTPVATNSIYPKNESSTSLSFSDDNSSIQSSPWQRDHCWKQAAPKRAISKEMCMFFKRTKKFTLSHDGCKTARKKRRRPHDNSMCKLPFTLVNGFIKTEIIDPVDIKKEVDEPESSQDDEENKTSNLDSENSNPSPVKTEDNRDSKGTKKCADQEKERRKPKTRAKLSTILEKLIDRLPTGLYYLSKVNPPTPSGVINHFPASARITELHNHQQHVSPRKRILRELEKVSLEDNSTKRSRAKTNASNSLTPASPSSSISVSQIGNTNIGTSQKTTLFTNSGTNNNNSQISNGNSNGTANDSSSNSNRLYSSYSIHSLLGNISSNNKSETNSKDSIDSSCLQIMLTSPNSSETYYSSKNAYTTNSGKRKSPSYNTTTESQNHNRRSSRESPNNFGPNYTSESSLSPDSVGRYKSGGSAGSSTSTFHPYLSSPKYSSTGSPTMANDSYKPRAGYPSNSPSHSQMASKMSSTSRSPVVSTYSQQSRLSNKNSSLNNNRFREQSPVESSSSSSATSDRRDGAPRTVPKKTVAFRQQFSSPTSSPSVVPTSTAEPASVYKSPSDQKRKNCSTDERTLSPESSKMYQASLDQLEQHRTNLLRAPSVLPPSPYYYFNPPHGSSGAHTSQPSYIPSLAAYYPLQSYAAAAAVAALRNPFLMHYQTAGLLPGPSPRIPFPYNGESSLGPPHPPGLSSSMHLPPGAVPPWPTALNLPNPATDDPVSLVNVKDEHNADVPLNLSKH